MSNQKLQKPKDSADLLCYPWCSSEGQNSRQTRFLPKQPSTPKIEHEDMTINIIPLYTFHLWETGATIPHTHGVEREVQNPRMTSLSRTKGNMNGDSNPEENSNLFLISKKERCDGFLLTCLFIRKATHSLGQRSTLRSKAYIHRGRWGQKRSIWLIRGVLELSWSPFSRYCPPLWRKSRCQVTREHTLHQRSLRLGSEQVRISAITYWDIDSAYLDTLWLVLQTKKGNLDATNGWLKLFQKQNVDLATQPTSNQVCWAPDKHAHSNSDKLNDGHTQHVSWSKAYAEQFHWNETTYLCTKETHRALPTDRIQDSPEQSEPEARRREHQCTWPTGKTFHRLCTVKTAKSNSAWNYQHRISSQQQNWTQNTRWQLCVMWTRGEVTLKM